MARTSMWNEQVVQVAQCFVDNESTVRKVAEKLHMPKTNVHLMLRQLIEHPGIYYKERELAQRVEQLITKNKQERHIRGGNQTKQKKAELRKKKQAALQANN